MTRLLPILAGALLLATLTAPAHAGMNAGAVAHMYWQRGTAVGLAATCVEDAQPQLVVTVTGLQDLRGADVQLMIHSSWGTTSPLAYGPYPEAWRMDPGGCASDDIEFHLGGVGGAYPNAWGSGGAVPGLVASQTGLVPPGALAGQPANTAVLWLSAAGSAGVPRDPTREYALMAWKFDLRGTEKGGTTSCAGDLSDGPVPVTIVADHFIPATDVNRGEVILLVDRNLAYDYIPILSNTNHSQILGWLATGYVGCVGETCGSWTDYCGTTPTKATSWGALRKLYR